MKQERDVYVRITHTHSFSLPTQQLIVIHTYRSILSPSLRGHPFQQHPVIGSGSVHVHPPGASLAQIYYRIRQLSVSSFAAVESYFLLFSLFTSWPLQTHYLSRINAAFGNCLYQIVIILLTFMFEKACKCSFSCRSLLTDDLT